MRLFAITPSTIRSRPDCLRITKPPGASYWPQILLGFDRSRQRVLHRIPCTLAGMRRRKRGLRRFELTQLGRLPEEPTDRSFHEHYTYARALEPSQGKVERGFT